ncbi:MAG: DUF721 domain-containing protein [Gemmatimonadota bacterium]
MTAPGLRKPAAGSRSATSSQGPRGPERVGDLVAALFEKRDMAAKVERAGVVAEWESIVGAHIARVTGDVRLRGRTLFVEVKSAAWLAELNMLRRDLIAWVNAGRSRGRIDRIVFVQGGRPPGGSESRWVRSGKRGSGPDSRKGEDRTRMGGRE